MCAVFNKRSSGSPGGISLLTALLLVGTFALVCLDSSVAFATELAAPGDTGVVGSPAPKLTAADYPPVDGFNGRVAVWLAAQLHLWFAAFVLAVPIFVFIIEAIGMRTRDKRYDDMAYEFIKVSITAYSVTAIFGGLLVFFLTVFYPHLFQYLASVFKESMIYYALLFFAESAALYVYYYGWHWLRGWLSFCLACSVGAIANVGIASYIFDLDAQWVLAALAGIIVGAVWNYAVTMVYTWKRPSSP